MLKERKAFVSRAAACNNNLIYKNSMILFVCAELIEELARATDLKFGMAVDVVARNKLSDLSDISTNF